jgi:CHAT domain-containing protein
VLLCKLIKIKLSGVFYALWKITANFFFDPEKVNRVSFLFCTLIGLPGLAFIASLYSRWEKAPALEARPSNHSRLREALQGVRLLEGQLSGGLFYSPYSPHRSSVLSPEVTQFARKSSKRDGSTLSDAVILDLLDRNLERAVGRVRNAIKVNLGEATLWSDLAALYLELFESTHQPYYLIEALAASDRAVRLAPSSTEATFNWALALERLFLNSQARVAWKNYLRLDKSSPWALEARQHLYGLAVRRESELWDQQKLTLDDIASHGKNEQLREIVDRFRQFARLHVENEVLPAWGRAVLTKQKLGQSNLLLTAESIGSSLRELTDDRLLSDSVGVIRSALARGDKKTVYTLARGHIAYGSGVSLDKKGRDVEALTAFAHSAEKLAVGGSPFSDRARVMGAYSEFYLGRHAVVASQLPGLPEQLIIRHYFSLASHARRLLGLAHFRLANLEISLGYYREALCDALRIGESESIAASHFMIAENLRFQGESGEAWKDRYHALQLATAIGRTVYRHNAMFDAAEALIKQDRPRMALFFQNEMTNGAIQANDPFLVTETLLRRSRTQLRLGNTDGANWDTKMAAEWLTKLPHEPRRDQLEADIKASLGEIALEINPVHAEALLGEALAFAERTQLNFRLPLLFQKHASAFLALGNIDAAEEELRLGIEESERQRARVLDEQLRISYFDQVQPIFDEMIKLQSGLRQSPENSFNFAERARTRNLLEAISAKKPSIAAGSLTLESLQANLMEGVTLIQYAVLDDQILAWTVTRKRLNLTITRLEKKALVARINMLNDCLRGECGSERSFELLSDLYDTLLLPLPLSSLHNGQVLIIVPDKELNRVPFAALVNRRTGRYLIEDATVGYSPSATLYVKSTRRDQLLGVARYSGVLAIGNPSFDRRFYPNLSSIPASEIEARRIGMIYANSSVLTGAAATRQAFLNVAPQYDIIHLATHAIVNSDYPLLSMLLLAPSSPGLRKKEEGAVYAYDVYRLSFQHTRLVVLSGCETAGGNMAAREGIGSLARPFLAAGVPLVVGNMWRVDDQSSSDFLSSFHTRLARGYDPLRALRDTQVSFIRGKDIKLRNPLRWAGYEAIGGFSSLASGSK